MDGENLRYGSTGTRLLITLLGILLNERFTTLLIDEPEIGLSPRIQAVLSRFLYDAGRRRDFCPHLRQLFVATHSHLLLDREVTGNNFVVTKSGPVVSVRQVGSVAEFHQLQFNMLGNELEAIFLPAAIIIVEGDSDRTFLNALLKLHVPDRKVAVVKAKGDGEVEKKLHFFREAFGEIPGSPYHHRLFVVYNKRTSVKFSGIEKQGVPNENVIRLTKNGIENYYPQSLVGPVFRVGVEEVPSLPLEKDPIEHNGFRKTKVELAQIIAESLTADHPVEPEIAVLLDKLRSACQ